MQPAPVNGFERLAEEKDRSEKVKWKIWELKEKRYWTLVQWAVSVGDT